MWGMASLWVQTSTSGGTTIDPPALFLLANATTASSIVLGWTNYTQIQEQAFSLFMNDMEVYRDMFNTTTVSTLASNTTFTFCVRHVFYGALGPCSHPLNVSTLP